MSPTDCPICERVFDADKSSALPFCTPRCKQIDLGRWLKEGYAIPGRPLEDEEIEPTAEQDSDDE